MSNNETRNPQKGMRGPGPGGPGGPGGMVSNEKAKDFKGTMKKLFSYFGSYRYFILVAFVFTIGSTCFTILGPKMLGNATTLLAEGLVAKASGTGSIDFDGIYNIMITLLGLYLTALVFSYVQGFIMTKVSQGLSYRLRNELSKKINRLPLSYFDKTTHGDVLSRITNDVDTIGTSLQQSLPTMLSNVILLFGIGYMMISISYLMCIVALIVVPLSLLLVVNVMKRSQKYFTKQQASLAKVNGHIEEMYGGHTIIKAFNREEESVKTFDEYNNELLDSAWRSQFLSGLMMPMTQFAGNIGYVLVCIVGGYLAIHNDIVLFGILFSGVGIAIGDIQAFIQYVRQFNQPIASVAQIMNMLQSTAAASERVFEFLEQVEEVNEVSVQSFDSNIIDGSVTFENVRFGYDPDKIIIKDFSMHVKDGQKIAIVGPTGAGKTTIVKLLMRFYELNSGTIYVGNKNIKEFTRKELRSLFGMVLQDANLFSGTIMDNLRYSKLDASDEEVIEAAKVAHVDHFVRTLEEGYHTVLNEDSSNISQGQKQLLTIARAFLGNPKVLILDEATSNIDTRTEVLIQKGMDALMKGRTSFVIAHRLSTIKNADLIIVLNEGDIVEVGNHNNLLEKKGFYEKLYNAQFDQEEE